MKFQTLTAYLLLLMLGSSPFSKQKYIALTVMVKVSLQGGYSSGFTYDPELYIRNIAFLW